MIKSEIPKDLASILDLRVGGLFTYLILNIYIMLSFILSVCILLFVQPYHDQQKLVAYITSGFTVGNHSNVMSIFRLNLNIDCQC